ncbi:MAG: PhoH family protein [Pirellulales bacterium]|nr:PhoH family protein [Pirellulales bacterium]
MNDSIPKLFVLDTNVVLHDAGCIDNFEENDIAIPITVLEELDKFKRGSEDIHFQAREFLRMLDALTGPLLSDEGASRGEHLGNIRVVLGGAVDQRISTVFLQDTPDHRILNTSLHLTKENKGRTVVLVSKDINLRMKAKSLGIQAEDYEADKVKNMERLYSGKRIVEHCHSDQIDLLYNGRGFVPESEFEQIDDPTANENYVLRNGSRSALATYSATDKMFRRIDKVKAYGIQPRNAEQAFALTALMNDQIRLVTIAGKAGTGKTLLALAAALESRARYRQILLARPIVPLSNRDLGYLPGDIQDKLDPYMQPLFDNLNVIRNQFKENDQNALRIREMLDNGKLNITPLSYIRGRSLQKMFFIIDEAQNLTPHEVKTVITRAGERTKVVLTGDLQQIDQPYLDALSNGLSHLINRMTGQPLYAHISLEKGERSELADLASSLL